MSIKWDKANRSVTDDDMDDKSAGPKASNEQAAASLAQNHPKSEPVKKVATLPGRSNSAPR